VKTSGRRSLPVLALIAVAVVVASVVVIVVGQLEAQKGPSSSSSGAP